MIPHNRLTGTGWHDHRPRLGKQVQLLQGDGASLVRITAVIGRLPAACLLLWEMDFDAFLLKQMNGVQPGFRGELIDEAGTEKVDIWRLGRINPIFCSICRHDDFSPSFLVIGKVVLPLMRRL
jgi:hypothetical protein